MRIAGTEAGRDGIYTVSTRNGIQYAEFIKIPDSQFFIFFHPPPAPSQRAGETMRIAGTEAGRDGIYTVSTRNGIQYAEFIKILNS